MALMKLFDRQGELVGPVDVPKLTLGDDEWRRRLTPEQFQILRSSATERPFCGALLDTKTPGVYSCAGCGLPLFASDAKFHSGTGWPSFFQPIAAENVAQRVDRSHGMARTEINCARCDGHLGHVFDDGPAPTGLRFCLNSESLKFTPSDQLATLADPLADSPANSPTEGTTAPAMPGDGAITPGAASAATAKSADDVSGETATAVFAGGCFWCTEAAFEQLEGVSDVTSGYTGGKQETADYQTVCTGRTGHAEAIRITYDPRRIGYDRLLDVFFDAHDPTQLNRQGADVGTQYRSAIFYTRRQTAGGRPCEDHATHRGQTLRRLRSSRRSSR